MDEIETLTLAKGLISGKTNQDGDVTDWLASVVNHQCIVGRGFIRKMSSTEYIWNYSWVGEYGDVARVENKTASSLEKAERAMAGRLSQDNYSKPECCEN